MKLDGEETDDVKHRCGICGKQPSVKQMITLHCSHKFCLGCIATNHETAVKNGHSENNKLYCPRCAEVTILTDGSVASIRPFYVCNRVRDLHTLTQMNREKSEYVLPDRRLKGDNDVDTIDNRSYTIEGPGPEDLLEADKELLGTETFTDETVQRNEAEPCDENIFRETTAAEHNYEDAFLCSDCKASDLVYYCFSCGKPMCDKCHKCHTETDEYKDHFGIQVDKNTVRALTCNTHNEFINQFCITCIQGICRNCHTSPHQNHECCDFCTPEESNQLMVGIQNHRSSIFYVLQKLDGLKNNLYAHSEALSKDVDVFVRETRISDDIISPLRSHLQESLTVTLEKLENINSEAKRSLKTLTTYEYISGMHDVIHGINDLAIKYRMPTLCDVLPVDAVNSGDTDSLTSLASHTVVHEQVEEELFFCRASSPEVCSLVSVEELEERLLEHDQNEPEALYAEATQLDSLMVKETAGLETAANAVLHECLEVEEITPVSHTVNEYSDRLVDELCYEAVKKQQLSKAPEMDEDAESQTLTLEDESAIREFTSTEKDDSKTAQLENGTKITEAEENTIASAGQTMLEEHSEQLDIRMEEEQIMSACRAMDESEELIMSSEKEASIILDSLTANSPVPSENSEPEEAVVKKVDSYKAQITWNTSQQLWAVRKSARSVAFLPSGTVLSAGREKLHAFNELGEELCLPFNASELNDPWKIAVHKRSSAVVVVDPTINAFTVYTPKVQSPDTQSMSDITQWDCVTHNLQGVDVPMCAVFSDDGHVILGTGSGRTLLKYTCSGDLLWKKSLSHDCYYLATDTSGRIITSGGGSIYIHDSTGDELHDFPNDKSLLSDPWGVCTDERDNVYVCQLNRPVVMVFSSSGKYIRELDFNNWPRDIALQNDRLLIASIHNIEMHQLN